MTNFPRDRNILQRLEKLERVRGFRPAVSPDPLPAIRLSKTSSQSISPSTWTRIAFNVVDKSTGGMTHSSGQVTVPREGWYGIDGNATFESSTSGALRILGIRTPAGYIAANTISSAQSPAAISTPQVSVSDYLDAGDTVELVAFVASAWALNVSQSYTTSLSVVYLGV